MISSNTRIYLSGPTGTEAETNAPAFDFAAREFRARGFTVSNPAENHKPHCQTWLGYMRIALANLVQCDAIVMLSGWERSREAKIELQLANNLGLIVVIAKDIPDFELH